MGGNDVKGGGTLCEIQYDLNPPPSSFSLLFPEHDSIDRSIAHQPLASALRVHRLVVEARAHDVQGLHEDDDVDAGEQGGRHGDPRLRERAGLVHASLDVGEGRELQRRAQLSVLLVLFLVVCV